MRTLILALFSMWTVSVDAQEIFMTRSGEITFFSSTPVEDIEAENKSVTCILKTASGELAFKVFMKSFHFERAAMQDHFNADYVHSDKYPQSKFSGTITDSDKIDFTANGTHEVEVSGELTMHGVTKQITESGTLTIEDGKISLYAVFNVLLDEYNIKVPSNYLKRISNEIEITVDAILEPYER